MSVDGLMSLWAEGLSGWLNAGNTQDGSAEIAVFLAAVRSMVATRVVPPRAPRCPTTLAQYFPNPGLAPNDRPKQKLKAVDP